MIQSILMVGAVKPGYASRNKWCLRCLLKTGNVKAEEIWVGSLFQTWDAVDEKDLEVAPVTSTATDGCLFYFHLQKKLHQQLYTTAIFLRKKYRYLSILIA